MIPSQYFWDSPKIQGMMEIEQSFETIKNEIKKYLKTDREIQAAKEISTDWVRSKRKLSQIESCDELFDLLAYRGVFGPRKINSLKLFQKLLDQDSVIELIQEHEKLLKAGGEPQPINKYAIERQRREQHERTRIQVARPPQNLAFSNPTQSIPPDKKIQIINLLKRNIENREISTFRRALQISDQDFQDIQRNHSQLANQTTQVLNFHFRNCQDTSKLISALKRLNRNDLIKSLQEILK